MTFQHAIGATKALTKAVPTVKNNGKVKKWDLTILYTCNGLTRDFSEDIDVEYLNKEATNFTKDELLGMCNTVQLDRVFDSMYASLVNPPEEERLDSFDITQLS